jgi:hypothetical protein
VGLDKFNIKKHSMIDILQSKYFTSFFIDSWNKKSASDGKLLFCVEVCGKKK